MPWIVAVFLLHPSAFHSFGTWIVARYPINCQRRSPVDILHDDNDNSNNKRFIINSWHHRSLQQDLTIYTSTLPPFIACRHWCFLPVSTVGSFRLLTFPVMAATTDDWWVNNGRGRANYRKCCFDGELCLKKKLIKKKEGNDSCLSWVKILTFML